MRSLEVDMAFGMEKMCLATDMLSRFNGGCALILLVSFILSDDAQARSVNTPLQNNEKLFSLYYREVRPVERFHAYCLADIDYYNDPSSENCQRSIAAINQIGQAVQMGKLSPKDVQAQKEIIIELLKNTELR